MQTLSAFSRLTWVSETLKEIGIVSATQLKPQYCCFNLRYVGVVVVLAEKPHRSTQETALNHQISTDSVGKSIPNVLVLVPSPYNWIVLLQNYPTVGVDWPNTQPEDQLCCQIMLPTELNILNSHQPSLPINLEQLIETIKINDAIATGHLAITDL